MKRAFYILGGLVSLVIAFARAPDGPSDPEQLHRASCLFAALGGWLLAFAYMGP